MKDSKIESLKKRTLADTICCLVIAIASLGIAFIEFIQYITTERDFPYHISNGIYEIMLSIILVLVSMILMDARKNEKPFSKPIIWKLRIMSVVIIIGSFMPGPIASLVDAVMSNSDLVIEIALPQIKNFMISTFGVIIGILSEIFVYGYELQEDMDSIA